MTIIKKILVDKNVSCSAVWFMRQAGRHLPEFRKIRSQNQDFIKLCLNIDLSSEITLQPIHRYNLDAAIIFSDILLVPFALGQEVNFIKNQGPILSEFNIDKFLGNKKSLFKEKLLPIYKSIKKTRNKLQKEKSLISFIGGPWTLLVYMLGLKESKERINVFKLEEHKSKINIILNELVEYLCTHIQYQIDAGADIVQIFDSWAGLIPETNLEEFCFKPNLKIVNFCKERKIPVICFPRGIKENYLEFCKTVQPNGINLDYNIDPEWAKKYLTNVVLQGGMHPQILLKADENIYRSAKKYLDIFKEVPYIFNLGHGIIPETSPDKLEKLITFVRKNK